MTEFPEASLNNTPELLAIRSAERDILTATNLNRQTAVDLGKNFVKVLYDYFVLFAVRHENLHLGESIRNYKGILDNVDSGNTAGLRLFLENRAGDMLSDPTWLIGQSEEMQEFPDKLRNLAKAIGN